MDLSDVGLHGMGWDGADQIKRLGAIDMVHAMVCHHVIIDYFSLPLSAKSKGASRRHGRLPTVYLRYILLHYSIYLPCRLVDLGSCSH